MSAVKLLIVIGHFQNKSLRLHNICVCSVYIYYIYLNTHTCMYIFLEKKIYFYILNIFIYHIIYLDII